MISLFVEGNGKGILFPIAFFVGTMIQLTTIASPITLFVYLVTTLLILLFIWFLNEKSKDKQHRRDMERIRIEPKDGLSRVPQKSHVQERDS